MEDHKTIYGESGKRFRRLLAKLPIPWHLLLVAGLLGLLAAWLALLFPDYQRQYFQGNLNARTLAIGLMILILAALIQSANRYFRTYLSERISRDFSQEAWQKTLHLRLDKSDEIDQKELLNRLAVDSRQLGDFLAQLPASLLQALISFIGAMVLIKDYHSNLAIFQGLIFLLFGLVNIFHGRINFEHSYHIQGAEAQLTGSLAELLHNNLLVKSFVREEAGDQQGQALIQKAQYAHRTHDYVAITFAGLDRIIGLGNRIFAILYGGYLIRQGSLNLEDWLAYFALVEIVYGASRDFFSQWAKLKDASGATDRLAQIMELPSEDYAGLALDNLQGSIRFEGVSLEVAGQEVLRDLTFSLNPNESLAILGGSGAGKTHLLKLLTRAQEPSSGQVLVQGQPMEDYDLRDYRSLFSYLPEKPFFFSGSLRENLSYGAGELLADEDILEALVLVGMADFVQSRPGGLDHQVQESGRNLSGGEKQRLSLARTLLNPAPIILLDETSTFLDRLSESEIIKEIHLFSSEKTLIYASNKPVYAKLVDKILYLEEGQMLGFGSHEQLMEDCPAYRHWYQGEELGHE